MKNVNNKNINRLNTTNEMNFHCSINHNKVLFCKYLIKYSQNININANNK